MSSFLTPVFLEPVARDKWRVIADVVFDSKAYGGLIVIPKDFVCDLDSIPRWVPVLYALLKGRAVRESVPHDFLYRQSGIARETADRVMHEAMTSLNQPMWVRESIYRGVRMFGGLAYKAKNPDGQQEKSDEIESDDLFGRGPDA